MTLTPGALTGTAQAIAYSSSPGRIALVGSTTCSWPTEEPLMCILQPLMYTPSEVRSTTWT